MNMIVKQKMIRCVQFMNVVNVHNSYTKGQCQMLPQKRIKKRKLNCNGTNRIRWKVRTCDAKNNDGSDKYEKLNPFLLEIHGMATTVTV